ncbi:DoxX protein [Aquiflexum balticum DSM 16537]|uniref:DoxX protein n=1 Tax=Aquiflexum balticum DSM 16537 TaxID=758820 RepID=A0A1W2H9L3_9BACT|nr:DoxX family membrane protein [Aquiflexum balticum]SMD45402.1 DoxX protein [Aquiflexum balticum DSM 16537]
MNEISKPDYSLLSFSRRARQNSWLHRGTLGLRFLLSMGFIPTGLVKLFGLPFSNLGSSSPIGVFFDMLLSTGVYWQFLGGMQVLAGILVMFNRTLALGSILFTGIMLNILFITIGVGFGNTAYLAFMMVLGCLWLCFWEWGKLRVLFFDPVPVLYQKEGNGLKSVELSFFEKIVYGIGYVSGMLFFGMTRGLKLPLGTEIFLVGIGLVCLIVAFILGFKANKR